MNACLTRQRDGSYMLTELEPVIVPVGGTGVLDAYVRALRMDLHGIKEA